MILDTDEDFLINFKTENDCKDYISNIRWGDKVVCPKCGSEKSYIIKDQSRFKCANNRCYAKFSVISGTRIEDNKLKFRVLLYYVFCLSKNKSISTSSLAKISGTSQKSSYYKTEIIKEICSEINRKNKTTHDIFLEMLRELLLNISKRNTGIGHYTEKGTSNRTKKLQYI